MFTIITSLSIFISGLYIYSFVYYIEKFYDVALPNLASTSDIIPSISYTVPSTLLAALPVAILSYVIMLFVNWYRYKHMFVCMLDNLHYYVYFLMCANMVSFVVMGLVTIFSETVYNMPNLPLIFSFALIIPVTMFSFSSTNSDVRLKSMVIGHFSAFLVLYASTAGSVGAYLNHQFQKEVQIIYQASNDQINDKKAKIIYTTQENIVYLINSGTIKILPVSNLISIKLSK